MSILDGIGKTFKSITKSPSKLLLASAAVYLGGGAMGWWNTPFESINGTWASADVAASASSSTASAGSMAGGELSALQSAFMPSTTRSTAEALLGSGGASSSDAVAQALAGGTAYDADAIDADIGLSARQHEALNRATSPKQSLTGTVIEKSLGLLKGVGEFAKENPVPTMMLGMAAANAASPNALDVLARKYQLERQESDRRRAIANQNLAVGGVQVPGIISRTRSA